MYIRKGLPKLKLLQQFPLVLPEQLYPMRIKINLPPVLAPLMISQLLEFRVVDWLESGDAEVGHSRQGSVRKHGCHRTQQARGGHCRHLVPVERRRQRTIYLFIYVFIQLITSRVDPTDRRSHGFTIHEIQLHTGRQCKISKR